MAAAGGSAISMAKRTREGDQLEADWARTTTHERRAVVYDNKSTAWSSTVSTWSYDLSSWQSIHSDYSAIPLSQNAISLRVAEAVSGVAHPALGDLDDRARRKRVAVATGLGACALPVWLHVGEPRRASSA